MNGERRRITVAILALGGQGGGVLSDWLIAAGERSGYYAQATSVQGVAQRTGTTVYYLEFIPEESIPKGALPVLALMPAPGDVDVVIASELMEAGRAILRGFVTRGRTALITSTHRVYAISEKSAVSGGPADSSKVMEAARQNAKSLVAFDMGAETDRTGSAISAVMLGAVAGAGVLPFSRAQYEAAIRESRIAVDANLVGFAAGFDAAKSTSMPLFKASALSEPTSQNGRRLHARVLAELPEAVHTTAFEGVRRLMDYQDAAYVALYLDRLQAITPLDAADWALTREAARALAVWMSYEDVPRVAQQKVRPARMDKVRAEVNVRPGQLLQVTEYMHPRWQELCDTVPARFGARLLRSNALKRVLSPWFEKGRHVRTTSLGWFIGLNFLASLRRARRGTLRYAQENARIEAWLSAVINAAATDRNAALELVKCQNLIKGYGDTHERGLRKFTKIMEAYGKIRGSSGAAEVLSNLRVAASNDEDGTALKVALDKIPAIV